jgi:hypothetical protein
MGVVSSYRVRVVAPDGHEVTVTYIACVKVEAGTTLDHTLHLQYIGQARFRLL